MFGDVRYSLAYLALLVYLVCVVTARINIATPAIIAALLGLAVERRLGPMPAFVFLLWAFLAWAFAGSFSSLDAGSSTDKLETLAKISVVAIIASRVLSDLARIRLFAIVLLASFLIYPVRGTLFAYFHGHRLFGRAIWQYVYENPNDLAAFCFLPLALALWLARHCPHKLARLALHATIGLILLVVLLTQSRGALIGLTSVATVFLFGGKVGAVAKRLAQTALLLVCVVPFVPSSAWQRFGGMSKLTSTATVAEADPEGSAGGRYGIWRNAVAIIQDYPAMGVGIGAYPTANWAYAKRLQYHPASMGFRDTHSTYLNVTAETGIPGIIIFLCMVAVSVSGANAARRRAEDPVLRDLLQFLLLALLAFMLAGVFGSFSRLNTLYLQMSMLSAAGALVVRQRAPVPSRSVAPAGRRPQ